MGGERDDSLELPSLPSGLSDVSSISSKAAASSFSSSRRGRRSRPRGLGNGTVTVPGPLTDARSEGPLPRGSFLPAVCPRPGSTQVCRVLRCACRAEPCRALPTRSHLVLSGLGSKTRVEVELRWTQIRVEGTPNHTAAPNHACGSTREGWGRLPRSAHAHARAPRPFRSLGRLPLGRPPPRPASSRRRRRTGCWARSCRRPGGQQSSPPHPGCDGTQSRGQPGPQLGPPRVARCRVRPEVCRAVQTPGHAQQLLPLETRRSGPEGEHAKARETAPCCWRCHLQPTRDGTCPCTPSASAPAPPPVRLGQGQRRSGWP